MTCIAAQQKKNAFSLKTLMLEEMLLFVCAYHRLLSGTVTGVSLPRFLVWQIQIDAGTMTTQGFVWEVGNSLG